MKRADKEFDPKAFLAGGGKGRMLSDHPKNHQIFLQGDPADAIFYIHKGKIKLTVVSKQGKEAVVALLGPGDFFGEGCLAGRPLVGSRTDVAGNSPSLAKEGGAGRPLVGSRTDVAGNSPSLAKEGGAGRPLVGSRADVAGNNPSLAKEGGAGRPLVGSRTDVAGNSPSLAKEGENGGPLVGSRADVAGNNPSLAKEGGGGRPLVGSRADVAGNNPSLAKEGGGGRPLVGSRADVAGNSRLLAEEREADRPVVRSRADASENRRSLADERWAGQAVRMASATALSDCSIMRMEKASVIRVLHDHPAFSELLLHHLLSRNIRIEEDLVDQLFNSSEKRLARVLLLLANFGKEGDPELVIPKISQETLAEIVGTTRSRVSFFMNRFRKMGFIQYSGQQTDGLEVHSSLLNVILHD
jgi:CRP-like cAMP-binding protein